MKNNIAIIVKDRDGERIRLESYTYSNVSTEAAKLADTMLASGGIVAIFHNEGTYVAVNPVSISVVWA